MTTPRVDASCDGILGVEPLLTLDHGRVVSLRSFLLSTRRMDVSLTRPRRVSFVVRSSRKSSSVGEGLGTPRTLGRFPYFDPVP